MQKVLQYNRGFIINGVTDGTVDTSWNITELDFTTADYEDYVKVYFYPEPEYFKVKSKITNREFVKLIGYRMDIKVEILIINETILAEVKELVDLISINANPNNRERFAYNYLDLSIILPLSASKGYDLDLNEIYLESFDFEDLDENLMIGEKAIFNFKRKIVMSELPTSELDTGISSDGYIIVDHEDNELIIGV